MADPAETDLKRRIRRDADQCVMCGLCLPHCPTYLATRDESESPRGRIALVSALAAGSLPLSKSLEGHLDRCLGCRACEAVCPSRVPYGELIDAGRSLIRRQGPPSALQRRLASPALKSLLTRTSSGRTAARLLRLARAARPALSLMPGAARRWPLLSRLQRYLPPDAMPLRRLRESYPAPAARGRVALFVGCVSPLIDAPAIEAALRLLNRLGYTVDVPRGQACCGALHQHAGDEAAAAGFARHNLAAFDSEGWEAVLFLATGCGATLAEYPRLPALDPALHGDAQRFAAACIDISRFLARCTWDGVAFKPGPAVVAVHEPCSSRRVLRSEQAVYEVLDRLPGSAVRSLEGNQYCCGAAGSYMLTQPQMSDRLLGYKVDAVRAATPDVVVSGNIGCALHLQAGLREAGIMVPVKHPVTLLDEYCVRPSPGG